MSEASKRQVGGSHYKDMGVQTWDVVDTWPREQQIGYYRGRRLHRCPQQRSDDAGGSQQAAARRWCVVPSGHHSIHRRY